MADHNDGPIELTLISACAPQSAELITRIP